MSSKMAVGYVRFSTLEQKQGNSLERQTRRIEDYCQEAGLRLRKPLYLDEGISAFSGKNKDADLGKLLNDMGTGAISRGSLLIVESLDRLSRENVFDHMRLFLEIKNHGIDILTLSDGKMHMADASENDFASMVSALVTMHRSNEESVMKSQRLRASWASKREKAIQKPLTSILPAWLEIKNGKIVAIPCRAKIVEEIFRDSSSGMGRRAVAKKLNLRNEPVWGSKKRNKSGLWNDSYIAKILMNRAVLGEFQAHTKSGGERKESGDPIQNYFPPVINETLFYACQGRAKERLGKGGRAAPRAMNLVNSFARCALCGGKMQFMDKGTSRARKISNIASREANPTDRYLQCKAAYLSATKCGARPMNYAAIERFLVRSIMVGRWDKAWGKNDPVKNIEAATSALEHEIQALSCKNEILLDGLEEGGGGIFRDRINLNLKKIDEKKKEIADLKIEGASHSTEATAEEAEVLARMISSGGSSLETRRAVRSILDSSLESAFLIRKEVAVGFCVLTKSGKIILGYEGTGRNPTDHFQISLEPWQLNEDGDRVATTYLFEEDRNSDLRPRPELFQIPKGRNLLSEFLSVESAAFLKKALPLPLETPNFKVLNMAQKEQLTEQLEDFRKLNPDWVLTDWQSPSKAGFLDQEGSYLFDEPTLAQKAEKNFRSSVN
jgi:DNA invertase Pin-like site-specific DNA recombinase